MVAFWGDVNKEVLFTGVFVRCGPRLFHFQIQSFVLYCRFFFSLLFSPPPSAPPPLHHLRGAESHPPSSWPLDESSREPCSHWLADTPRRALAPFFCLHAAGENPNNNCYCCQRAGIRSQSASQTHANTHTHTGAMHKHTNISLNSR